MSDGADGEAIDRAVRAIRDGGAVVYPTETVYGLGADATDPAAIERVFAIKGRDRSKPLSLGVDSIDAARAFADLSERAEAFAREFLPGPVTVLASRTDRVPDALTGGEPRVGIRVPDHGTARALARRAGPITATSANLSGAGSATRIDEIDPAVREAAGAVIDGGGLDGVASTVVDPERGEIVRRGAAADAIEAWLQERS